MKLLSPEQQLKEKRPGMPQKLKGIYEQQIRDIPPNTIWTRAEPLNYPRVISLQDPSRCVGVYDAVGKGRREGVEDQWRHHLVASLPLRELWRRRIWFGDCAIKKCQFLFWHGEPSSWLETWWPNCHRWEVEIPKQPWVCQNEGGNMGWPRDQSFQPMRNESWQEMEKRKVGWEGSRRPW